MPANSPALWKESSVVKLTLPPSTTITENFIFSYMIILEQNLFLVYSPVLFS